QVEQDGLFPFELVEWSHHNLPTDLADEQQCKKPATTEIESQRNERK
ncbi:MAG: hypothetical protein QOC67_2261, partial [Pseudonocardiales bacterium]|nr:hypothetical protein [Pseudonocardiales bacterium]